MDYENVHSRQTFTGTLFSTRAHVFTHNHSNLISPIGRGMLLIKIVFDVNLMLIVFIIIVRPESLSAYFL